jgi:predicted MFS family arabinose efflux permease
MYIDRVDRRRLSAGNFVIQIAALGTMLTSPPRPLLYAACAVFGFGVGNMITFPGLLVQQEFPPERFARIVSLIVACTQFTFALGPAAIGIGRDLTGGYAAPLTVAMLLHGAATALVLVRGRASAAT